MGDIQVNLLDKKHRQRSSHKIALFRALRAGCIGRGTALRSRLSRYPRSSGHVACGCRNIWAGLPVTETTGHRLVDIFGDTPDIVDIDSSVESEAIRYVINVDRQKAALLGVSQQQVSSAVALALGGEDISYIHRAHENEPIPVRMEIPVATRPNRSLMALEVRSLKVFRCPSPRLQAQNCGRGTVQSIHKDLLPVVFVTADMSGELDSPLYGMFELSERIDKLAFSGGPLNSATSASRTIPITSHQVGW